jgi:hypothetical protein
MNLLAVSVGLVIVIVIVGIVVAGQRKSHSDEAAVAQIGRRFGSGGLFNTLLRRSTRGGFFVILCRRKVGVTRSH